MTDNNIKKDNVLDVEQIIKDKIIRDNKISLRISLDRINEFQRQLLDKNIDEKERNQIEGFIGWEKKCSEEFDVENVGWKLNHFIQLYKLILSNSEVCKPVMIDKILNFRSGFTNNMFFSLSDFQVLLDIGLINLSVKR